MKFVSHQNKYNSFSVGHNVYKTCVGGDFFCFPPGSRLGRTQEKRSSHGVCAASQRHVRK